MDPDRLAEEIRTKMIRQSLIEPDISSQGQRRPRTMLDYQRRLKDTKVKIVATDSMIRKVRAGEMDLKYLRKEVNACKEKNRRSRREFVRKLVLLASLSDPEHSENENIYQEFLEATEDQKAILLLNKKKHAETLRKEARLLMEVIFGRNLTREHIELLQKEYQKTKPDNTNIM